MTERDAEQSDDLDDWPVETIPPPNTHTLALMRLFGLTGSHDFWPDSVEPASPTRH